jgi:hypothetical protein
MPRLAGPAAFGDSDQAGEGLFHEPKTDITLRRRALAASELRRHRLVEKIWRLDLVPKLIGLEIIRRLERYSRLDLYVVRLSKDWVLATLPARLAVGQEGRHKRDINGKLECAAFLEWRDCGRSGRFPERNGNGQPPWKTVVRAN